MGPVVLSTVVALLTALGVVLLSATVTGVARSAGPREFFADLYAGLRGGADDGRDAGPDTVGARGGPVATARDDDEDEGSLEELFVVGRPDAVGYVEPVELADALVRARDAVRGGVAHLTRR